MFRLYAFDNNNNKARPFSISPQKHLILSNDRWRITGMSRLYRFTKNPGNAIDPDDPPTRTQLENE